MAVILAGGEGERLSILSSVRAKPAVPFGGKYRIIDFTLSNCVNSDIDDVLVLTQYNPHSLNDHIGLGRPWDLDRNRGGVKLLQPYIARGRVAEWYRGTADAVLRNMNVVEHDPSDVVVVLAGDHIYKMDYQPFIAAHRRRRADVTIAVRRVPLAEASRMGILALDDADRVTEWQEKPKQPKSDLASMGVYVFSKKALRRWLSEDRVDFGRHIIPAMLEAIRGAQHSINMELYIFQPGKVATQFITALSERARHGVNVTIVVDALGSFSLWGRPVRRLRKAGCRIESYQRLRWYSLARLNNRTHRELLIVDGRIGFAGGPGIADWWMYKGKYRKPWRDTMARIEGPVVAAMQGVAAENWLECCGEILTGPDYFPDLQPAGNLFDMAAWNVDGMPVQLDLVSDLGAEIVREFDELKPKIIGSAITNLDGYLPTHLSERCHTPGPDPVWNDEHCRNKRIFMDEQTRAAIESSKPAMLMTYRMELGDKYIPVKNVFVPLSFKGRRWGNFELAYRDE